MVIKLVTIHLHFTGLWTVFGCINSDTLMPSGARLSSLRSIRQCGYLLTVINWYSG